MMIVGYRPTVNTTAGVKAITKHTGVNLGEARRMIDNAIEGQSVMLDSDWVLREDLEDSGFIVS